MDLSRFKNKKVLIFGLGLHGGGFGAARFFSRLGSRVTVTDRKTRKELLPALRRLSRYPHITYALGGHRRRDVLLADLIVQNPGVPADSPFLMLAKKRGIPVSSDVEIFFHFSPAPIIGITGTKGKSTAAYLLSEFLREDSARRRVFLAGNIRKSVLEILPRLRRGDRVILELSSFQLDMLARSRMSPQIAAITNIYPEHLNRYKNFSAYERAKTNIFRFQKSTGRLFVPKQDARLARISRGAKSKRILVDVRNTIAPWKKEVGRRYLPHQAGSVALAIAMARFFGVSDRAIGRVLARARPLPGRIEVVRRVGGVVFINDTTATNPGAAKAALVSLRPRYRGIVLIAGGSAKGLSADALARAIVKCANAVIFLPGSATPGMKRLVRRRRGRGKGLFIGSAASMRGAVREAYRRARPGDAVLLSPGATSFGIFRHEFDRGAQFVRSVRMLQK